MVMSKEAVLEFWIYQNWSVYLKTVLYISKLFFISQNCSVFLRTVLYISELFFISQNWSGYLRTVLFIPELIWISQNCSVYLRTCLLIFPISLLLVFLFLTSPLNTAIIPHTRDGRHGETGFLSPS